MKQNRRKVDAASLKIERLRDKENWHQWKFVIRTLLEDDDNVLAVCAGSLVHPEPGSNNYDVQLKKFSKADKTSRKFIVTTVEKKPMELIMSCSTAREMWLKLNSIYDMKSDENLSLFKNSFSITSRQKVKVSRTIF